MELSSECAFEVLSLFLEAFPPSLGPGNHDCMPILKSWDGCNLLTHCFLQVLQGTKSDTPQVVLEPVIQPKVTGCQIWGTCRVRQVSPTKLVYKGKSQGCLVCTSIVKMQKPPAMDSAVWSPSLVGCVKPVKDGSEHLLVHCLRPLNILKVDQTLTVKKRDQHDLPSCQSMPWNLGVRLFCTQPVLVVDSHCWIPHIYPGLIHGDDVPEHSWVLSHQSAEEVANIPASLLVCICEYCEHKCGASLLQLEILLQNSVHCCWCNPRFDCNFPHCHTPVCSYQILHPADVPLRATGFASRGPGLILK